MHVNRSAYHVVSEGCLFKASVAGATEAVASFGFAHGAFYTGTLMHSLLEFIGLHLDAAGL